MIKNISDKVLLKKLTSGLSLVCERCQDILTRSESGPSRWRYDDETDRVICPACIKELRDLAVEGEILKITSFIAGAEWALSKFYDEIKGTQSPCHIKRDINLKRQMMTKAAMRKIRAKFGDPDYLVTDRQGGFKDAKK